MSVYKHPKTGKWYCIFRVTETDGTRRQIKKSGFARKGEAKEYERRYPELNGCRMGWRPPREP